MSELVSLPYELSVIVPTYSEEENISLLIGEVEKVFQESGIHGELVIVDDNSPDGTAAAARQLNEEFGNIQVLVRTCGRGLSASIIDGFKIARSDHFLVMDADLSHPPEIIPRLYAPLQKGEARLVFGCRYMKGGGIADWTLKRRIISRGASCLAKVITRIRDPMSGLFSLHRSVLEGIDFHPKGFKIGLEIVARGNYDRIAEIPYFFRDRRFGKSKLDRRVMKDFLEHLLLLLFAKNSVFVDFLKFSLVGLTGLALNLLVLYSLVEWFPFWNRFGNWAVQKKVLIAAVVAFGLAVSSNYLWNRFWTFKRRKANLSPLASYSSFVIVSLGGLAINIFLLKILHYQLGMWYMTAQVISICAASLWNFIGSEIWAFKSNRR